MKQRTRFYRLMVVAAVTVLGGCVTPAEMVVSSGATSHTVSSEKFEQDRQAILAMAGNYRVSFDFIETVSFVEGYDLKDRKISGGDEIVRVIEDRGDYISLQHILVVGGDSKFPVKHWRQDWYYQPTSVLTNIGGNAWEKRRVSENESRGKWSQIVYQVDDAPRYGALAKWHHDNGASQWTADRSWRPLPRRDATTRDDYDVVDAINRHAITPAGWVHEQDNAKLILSDDPQILVREIAINTYRKFDDFEIAIGDDYWAATQGFWAGVRAEWGRIEATHERFGLNLKGEPQALYNEILLLANDVQDGAMSEDQAIAQAGEIIGSFLEIEIGDVKDRIE